MSDPRNNSRRGEREGRLHRRILAESEALDRHLDRTWTRLGGTEIPTGAPAWQEEVRGALSRLHESLRRLFALEEGEGGFFAEIVDRRPDQAARIEELRRQHLSILRQMEGLIERVEGNASCEDAALAKNLVAFLESLRTQRSIERSLLQGTFLVDEGVAD